MKPYIIRRNLDFISLCLTHIRNIAAQGKIPSPPDIVRAVLAEPAPAFYADPDYAIRMVRFFLNHGKFPKCKNRDQLKWQEFIIEYLKQVDLHPGCSPKTIITRLCDGEIGSPHFHISFRQALKLLRLALKSS